MPQNMRESANRGKNEMARTGRPSALADEQNERMQREIESGCDYANLAVCLSKAKDHEQFQEIRKTMAELIRANGYLSRLLESYGVLTEEKDLDLNHPFVGNALTMLASCASLSRDRDRFMVFQGDLHSPVQGMHYGLSEIPQIA